MAPKTKLYITIAVIVLIFTALILGVISPLIKKNNSLSAQYASIKQKIADIEEKRNQIAKTEKEYDKIKNSIAKIDASLSDSSKFLDIIIRLEQMAEKTGNIHEITIMESDKSSKKELALQPKYLSFRIILYGTFENAISFINNLENADFYGKIEKMEMEKMENATIQQSSQGVKDGDIKTIMEIKIFTK